MTTPPPQKKITIVACVVATAMTLLFYADFFSRIDSYIVTNDATSPYRQDWAKERTYYANLQHQVFERGRFPHYLPEPAQGTYYLFASPETSVVSPVNALLPLTGILDFFSAHLLYHYLFALVGIALLCRLLELPASAILLAYVLFAFNGRLVCHYWCGHTPFITITYFPLVLYFYLGATMGKVRVWTAAAGTGALMALVVYEGGGHPLIWLVLLFVLISLLHGLELIFAPLLRKRGIFPPRDESPLAVNDRGFGRLFVYLALSAVLAGLFSAMKLLPAMGAYGGLDPGEGAYSGGYHSWAYLIASFHHAEAGSPFVAMQAFGQATEAYNFIGPEWTVVAVFSLVFGIFVSSSGALRKLSVIAVIFAALSYGDTYQLMFQNVPLLRLEAVATRLTMMTLCLIAITIPMALIEIVTKLGWAAKRRAVDIALIAAGGLAFARLYWESRKWMVPGNSDGGDGRTPLTDLGYMPGDELYFSLIRWGTGITAVATAFVILSFVVARNERVRRLVRRKLGKEAAASVSD